MVVVLLPLSALGGLIIALRARWRRRFGPAVLLLTVVSVGVIPLVTTTGRQLKAELPENPAIDRHAALGDNLLPFALAFGVAVLLLVIAGWLADREPATVEARKVLVTSTMWRRIAIVAAALVAFTAVAATVQVARVGHSGATAVWKGVGGT